MDNKKKYTSLEHQIRLMHENAAFKDALSNVELPDVSSSSSEKKSPPSEREKLQKLKEAIEQVAKKAKAKKDKAANPNVDFNPTTIERGENESMVKND
jgi:hypothetical protein